MLLTFFFFLAQWFFIIYACFVTVFLRCSFLFVLFLIIHIFKFSYNIQVTRESEALGLQTKENIKNLSDDIV